jgi:plastocyanin domain-containing protein
MRTLLFVLVLLASCKQQLTFSTASRSPASAASSVAGPEVKEIAVTSKGFEPARVEVAPGKPVILRFTRKVAETCADAVDVQNDPVRHMLPLDTPVDVKVVAPASGQLAFACPMQGMIHGAMVVVGN